VFFGALEHACRVIQCDHPRIGECPMQRQALGTNARAEVQNGPRCQAKPIDTLEQPLAH
jgi:hypothetical protein